MTPVRNRILNLVNHWLDVRRLRIRRRTFAWLVLIAACSGPPVVVPAPPPPPPPIASSPEGRAVLALAASTPPPAPYIRVTDDTTRPLLTGSSVSEIGRQLGLDRGGSDSEYIGATAAEFHWQFGQRRVGDTCAITDVLVILAIRTRLPQWQHNARASATLTQQWNEFLKA